jgi:hypothetical protein
MRQIMTNVVCLQFPRVAVRIVAHNEPLMTFIMSGWADIDANTATFTAHWNEDGFLAGLAINVGDLSYTFRNVDPKNGRVKSIVLSEKDWLSWSRCRLAHNRRYSTRSKNCSYQSQGMQSPSISSFLFT